MHDRNSNLCDHLFKKRKLCRLSLFIALSGKRLFRMFRKLINPSYHLILCCFAVYNYPGEAIHSSAKGLPISRGVKTLQLMKYCHLSTLSRKNCIFRIFSRGIPKTIIQSQNIQSCHSINPSINHSFTLTRFIEKLTGSKYECVQMPRTIAIQYNNII